MLSFCVLQCIHNSVCAILYTMLVVIIINPSCDISTAYFCVLQCIHNSVCAILYTIAFCDNHKTELRYFYCKP